MFPLLYCRIFCMTRKASVSLATQHQNTMLINFSKGKYSLQSCKNYLLTVICYDYWHKEYTRSLLLQHVYCKLCCSPFYPTVVEVHLRFLLRTWSYMLYRFYSWSCTQVQMIMKSEEILSTWFLKTLVCAVSSHHYTYQTQQGHE